MRVPDPEHPVRFEDSQAGLDRFEGQAACILALALTLSGVSYAILMQVFL